MRGAIRIRDKKVIRRVRRIAEETGQPASEIAERAIDAYVTAYEAARSSADTHMDEHEDLIARVREGDADGGFVPVLEDGIPLAAGIAGGTVHPVHDLVVEHVRIIGVGERRAQIKNRM